jgi:tRNA pseudouridine55 synthase
MNQPVKRKRVPVHGVLLLDKPVGLSSAQALAKAKWLLNAEKAGHTGTLDPFATGLLPLCFGEATKFAQDLLDADKTYEATVQLGVTTTTGDTEGEVMDTKQVNVTREQVEMQLSIFRGPIQQVPPMHSALKRDGKPLYEYAREGITLAREAREVTIHALELLEFAPSLLKLSVTCSKGTYVRVLGEDLGAALDCGAHLSALRRMGIDTLDLSRSITLDDLSALSEADRLAHLLPVDALLSKLPRIELDAELARRFGQGQRIALNRAGLTSPCDEGRVRVYENETLLGTAQLTHGVLLAPERLIANTPSH